jgi:hypothetical protein
VKYQIGQVLEDGSLAIDIKGYSVLISRESYGLVETIKWYPCNDNGNIYFVGKIKRRTVKLHRVIKNALKGTVVDHINRNTLDNRISNLRITTKSGNNINQKTRKSILGERLISRHGNGFVVQGKIDSGRVRKYFIDLNDAKRFRDEILKKQTALLEKIAGALK